MKRTLLPTLLLATLAGCASAPKKPAPQPTTAAASVPAPPVLAVPGGACSKHYAPAQEDPGTRGNYTAGGLYAPGVADTTPDYVPDLDCIAEPQVVALPRSKVGNRSPYVVMGRNYQVLDRVEGYVEQGTASYYGNKFHGRLTSNREVYDMYAFTAAHKSLPLPSFARVTNLDNGRSVVVRVNDRGPFHEGRVIDLSYAAAVKLDITRRGTGRVEVRALAPGDAGTLRAAAPAAAPSIVATTIATGIPTRIATGRPTPMDQLVERLPQPQPAMMATALQANAPAVADSRTAVEQDTAAAAEPPAPVQPWRYQVTPETEKAPSTQEFDAWMQSRGVRVATGKPAAMARPPGTTPAPASATPQSATAVTPEQPNPPAVVASAPIESSRVQLQVGSFASRENADRALARLAAAGIARASLSDVARDGRTLWRLRVGASDVASASQIAARIAGLGFGEPQVVRE